MQFKLFMEDKEKTFSVPFVKGRLFRKALKMNKVFNEGGEITEEVTDQLVDFVCEVFNSQFTPDDVWDGMPLDGILPALQGVFFEVIDRGTKSIQGGTDTSKND
ncbi:hypothetical protein SAMN05444673_2590 [Bacillus sp. OV166]|uniref:phage tail assembly chaperone G n=1 Tax=Bacillus sp. OV166 TaxID=1882763 RepID=UPI000A2AAE55|nr:hypothetical protein [Bacillus sp. OV166]SMQ75967.1 hypothetical protein SAMN05444673_2590 [Bacillus sp. OV166]